MLTDLPVAAVRYAALLNIAIRSNGATHMMVDWIRHGTGIYEQKGFEDLPWLEQWPHEKQVWKHDSVEARMDALRAQSFRSDYGVADDISQVLAHYPDLATSDVPYLLTYSTMTRENAPDWRWHKHGPYIGTQHPTMEHLGDEPVIEQVICWDLWQVLPQVDDLARHWRPELADWLTARMAGRQAPRPVLA